MMLGYILSLVMLIGACLGDRCAPASTFSSVPVQVKGYAGSFRRNYLYGDVITTTSDSEECKNLAIEDEMPNYFFDSAATKDNCLRTHVSVNTDFYFPDPSQNTDSAVDKIQQRVCKYDGVTPANVKVVDFQTHTLAGAQACSENNPTVHATLRDDILEGAYKDIADFNAKCSNAKISLEDLKVLIYDDKIDVTATTKVVPVGDFPSYQDVDACVENIVWPEKYLVVKGCGEDQKAYEVGEMIRYTVRECKDDNCLFGPNNYNCYRRDVHPLMKENIYEIIPGQKCTLPEEQLLVQESIFACYLGCANAKSCEGFLYDIEQTWCRPLMGKCVDAESDDNFIFYKKK